MRAIQSPLNVILLVSLLTFAGCDNRSGGDASATPVTVTAVGYKGFDMRDDPATSYGEYVVVVTMRNNGKQALVCDSIEGRYYSETGPVLRQPVVNEPKGRPITIEPGKSWTWDFATDGYTRELFVNAKGKPIYFGIAAKSQDKDIVGPLYVILATLGDLPLRLRSEPDRPGMPLQLQATQK